ncbi:hypothetical protein EWI07_11325 [Sporolactobacillus sp. THM7-4]|nr:hypothetical protein EWI07_11325 [Sporolactobacillus sp. THM7-4]
MKKFFTATIFGLILVLGACGGEGKENYDQAIRSGLNAVAAGQYNKAEASFGQALASKKEDKQATVLLAHTHLLKQAQESLNEGNFDDAIHSANVVINQGANKAAVRKAEAIKTAAVDAKNKKAAARAASRPASSGSEQSASASSTSGSLKSDQAASPSSTSESDRSTGESAGSSGSSSQTAESSPQQSAQKQAEASVARAAG